MSAGQATDSFLGVERSLNGKAWRLRLADARAGLTLAQRLDLPEIVGRVLAGRGITPDGVEAFLNPSLRGQLPDPSRLRDMDAATERVARAVITGERVAVFGDYDVDGATSAALLHRFLSTVGAPPLLYIPDRLTEGYGPNTGALMTLREKGAKVVITVDCGTTAHDPLKAAADAELDVIVLDHHVAEARLPPAFAVVNPNRLDEAGDLGQLAAVGVAFLLVVALNRALRAAGWYEGGRREPDLLQWLDLVALGTVCDVVPLTGLNRALVSQGLRVMARRANPGLAALADAARMEGRPGAYHAGFVLGPRINAGGRVGEADLGARLLTTGDAVEAADLARRLDTLNLARQEIEARVLEAATACVEDAGGPGALVFAAGEGWHLGVIGIVASRLAERYNRPACIVGLKDGVGRGSGRSMPGVPLGTTVLAARQAGLLIDGGGHPMAAGFTVAAENLDDLQAFLEERIGTAIAAGGVISTLSVDGALVLEAATTELAGQIETLAPFGAGNAEPVLVLSGARVAKSDVVGGRHVRCFLTGPGGGRLKAIAFRSLETPLGAALLDRAGAPLHLAGRLRADNWQGRDDVQFIIADGAPVH
jgi:single-stranded-DNA-specific exonuclease